ncbi:MAG: helix-turn-helix domain-containing protein [candidate division Zixibacteria bacterium]|nr:helix-turn-helix domain-containing protein [candidate division Zixibacteria bacterium]
MKCPSSKIIDSLWTISDVATFCQVKESVVRYWINNSNLPYIKLGKFIRFQQEDVRTWVDGRKSDNRLDTDVLKLLRQLQ